MITLYVEPNTIPMKWMKFFSTKRHRSIALDGYVETGPRFNPNGPWANFNHHEEVSRLETRATCAQVLIAVRQGLFDCFQNEKGNADANIFVNDCDEDVSLSVFMLMHHQLVTSVMNPMLNRLVFMEDMMDTTAGAYPFPKDLDTLQELMWVFEPYHRFRVSGQLDKRDADAFRSIIEDVGRRIIAYITGSGGRLELDTRYEVVDKGVGWSMIREIGGNARLGVYADGIRAFVAVRERSDGGFVYTLGRSSQFVRFPIPRLLKTLNREEQTGDDRWGGSDTIAGSPRVGGSKLDPDELKRIINETLCSLPVR